MTATISETGSVTTVKASTIVSRLSAGKFWQVGGPGVIFIVMFAVVAILTPAFIGSGGITIVASSAAPILLVALGQAFVLNIGSIDLSNAAVTVLGAILLAMFLGPLAAAAPLAVLAMVTLFGALNGFLLAYTQVPSFALTLGTLGIFKAASLVVSGATTVYVSENKEVVSPLYTTQLAGLPITFVLGVIVAVLAFLFLRFTRVGMGMTAIGKNESGAIFAAVDTRALKITAFALSGFMAGLASMTIIAQAGSASAMGLGSDLLLPAIAAAIVGGTSISGGVTNPLNVILGALTIALVPIATAAIGVPAEAQNLVYGLVIIVVVILTLTQSRTAIVK